MAVFLHPLWGFSLTYPDAWVHRTSADVDGFAQGAAAFDQAGAINHQAAHILVRGEFNGRSEPIAPGGNGVLSISPPWVPRTPASSDPAYTISIDKFP